MLCSIARNIQIETWKQGFGFETPRRFYSEFTSCVSWVKIGGPGCRKPRPVRCRGSPGARFAIFEDGRDKHAVTWSEERDLDRGGWQPPHPLWHLAVCYRSGLTDHHPHLVVCWRSGLTDHHPHWWCVTGLVLLTITHIGVVLQVRTYWPSLTLVVCCWSDLTDHHPQNSLSTSKQFKRAFWKIPWFSVFIWIPSASFTETCQKAVYSKMLAQVSYSVRIYSSQLIIMCKILYLVHKYRVTEGRLSGLLV